MRTQSSGDDNNKVVCPYEFETHRGSCAHRSSVDDSSQTSRVMAHVLVYVTELRNTINLRRIVAIIYI